MLFVGVFPMPTMMITATTIIMFALPSRLISVVNMRHKGGGGLHHVVSRVDERLVGKEKMNMTSRTMWSVKEAFGGTFSWWDKQSRVGLGLELTGIPK